MRISDLIIDDFCDNSHAVRNAALHTNCARATEGANYPLDSSAEVFAVQGLNDVASNFVGEPVMGTAGPGSCRFPIATAGAEERARARMHVDCQSYWSGIVYLNLPERCRGGTEFYRHQELGTDRALIFDKEIVQYGSDSGARCTREIIQRDSNDDSKS